MDRTHRKRRWRVNAVATPVTGFNPVRLFPSAGFVKDTAAVALVDRDMLTRVWNEMDYRRDVCRITKGGHIEYLLKKNLQSFSLYRRKNYRDPLSSLFVADF